MLVYKRWTGRSGKNKVFFASFAYWQKIRKIGRLTSSHRGLENTPKVFQLCMYIVKVQWTVFLLVILLGLASQINIFGEAPPKSKASKNIYFQAYIDTAADEGIDERNRSGSQRIHIGISNFKGCDKCFSTSINIIVT